MTERIHRNEIKKSLHGTHSIRKHPIVYFVHCNESRWNYANQKKKNIQKIQEDIRFCFDRSSHCDQFCVTNIAIQWEVNYNEKNPLFFIVSSILKSILISFASDNASKWDQKMSQLNDFMLCGVRCLRGIKFHPT